LALNKNNIYNLSTMFVDLPCSIGAMGFGMSSITTGAGATYFGYFFTGSGLGFW
jgi:hypothetical protein